MCWGLPGSVGNIKGVKGMKLRRARERRKGGEIAPLIKNILKQTLKPNDNGEKAQELSKCKRLSAH